MKGKNTGHPVYRNYVYPLAKLAGGVAMAFNTHWVVLLPYPDWNTKTIKIVIPRNATPDEVREKIAEGARQVHGRQNQS